MTRPSRTESEPTAPMTPLTREPSAQSGTHARAENAERAVTHIASAERRQRVLRERDEAHGERRRLVRAVIVGLSAWFFFGAFDFVMYSIDALPRIGEAIGVRLLLGVPAIAIAWWVHRRPDASRRAVRAGELFIFTLASVSIGLFAIIHRGIESHYIHGGSLVLLGHAVTLGSSWRRALAPVLLVTLAIPVTLGLGAFFDVELARQWADPESGSAFLQAYTFVVGAAGLALMGGQATWSLRQQVIESRSVGRYQLRRRIAAGGMGEVWSAYHGALKREVAVKLMQPRLGQDARAIERFEREVQTLAELEHPNVVRVFDYGVTEDGVWYYAMELVHGDDLRTIVEREGSLVPKRALGLIAQAAEALGDAHAHGIVHRDVKPANLLVVRREAGPEFVKLIDFGIAKADFATKTDESLTDTGMIVGTPGYIAPEVITGAPATPRSDVYALGAVLYYLLAGKVPLEADTPRALAVLHLDREPPRPSDRLGRSIPQQVEDVVMRCLKKDPFERYADGDELAAALRAIGA